MKLKNIERWFKRKILKKDKPPKFERQKLKFQKKYPNYSIGDGSYGTPIVYDWNEGSTLNIGSYCSIAPNVQIFLGGHHRIDWISSYPFPEFVDSAKHITDYGGTNGDVVIGSDVWLCANCTILSGVKIGHGAVIANGAVVSRDVEPYTIVAGNPAKVIKQRFDSDTTKQLLDLCWWDWPAEEIKNIAPMLCSNNFDALFSYANNRQALHNQHN